MIKLNIFGFAGSAKEPTFPVPSVTFIRFYCGQLGTGLETPVSAHAALSNGISKDVPCENRVMSDIVRNAPADAYAFQIMTANRLRGLFGHKTKIQPPADPVWIGEIDERNFELHTRDGQTIALSSLAHVYTPEGVRTLPKISENGAAAFAQYTSTMALRK